MCGIAGMSIRPDEVDLVNTKFLSTLLLLDIESRGWDATGVAWRDPNEPNHVFFLKEPEHASAFVGTKDFTQRFDPNARQVVLHTRFTTQGSEKDNRNNHPVITGTIAGVHNGVILNDDDLFYTFGGKREALVDTEAIYSSMTMAENPIEVMESLHGWAALAWLDTRDENLHLARVIDSPLFIGESEGGSVIFSSHKEGVEEAFALSGLQLREIHSVPEGVYIIHNDDDVDIIQMDPCLQNTYMHHKDCGHKLSWFTEDALEPEHEEHTTSYATFLGEGCPRCAFERTHMHYSPPEFQWVGFEDQIDTYDNDKETYE